MRARSNAGAGLLVGVLAAVATLATGCRSDSGSTEELCSAYGDGRSFNAVFEDFDPTDTPRALDQLRTARVELGELHAAAPSEARSPLQVEIDYVQALIDALEGVDSATEAVSAVRVVTAQHPDVDEASADLETFVTTRCPAR